MYHHLTARERETISQMHAAGAGRAAIGRALNRSPGTISRELARNGVGKAYSAVVAQERATARRKDRPLSRKMDDVTTNEFVRSGLVENWSPEQIAGRARLEKKAAGGTISRQTIYRWIEKDKDREHWKSFLRRRGKRRPKHDRRGQLPGIVNISGRPQAANNRSQRGHWEGDTIVSPRKRNGLLTLTDRKSGFVKIRKLKDLKAKTTLDATRRVVKQLPSKLARTATFDQGKEFANLSSAKGLFPQGVFFADPGCPWQRGTNENTNGLIRQFIPKGTDISKRTHQEIKDIEDSCNNRPRKRLGFRTPNEVFLENKRLPRCA